LAPLIQGRILETVAHWPEVWFFSCTLMLTANEADATYRNIIYISNGLNGMVYGSRIVALYTKDFTTLVFSSRLYESGGTVKPLHYETELTLRKDYDISIRHVKDEAAENFRYEISLNGELVHRVINYKNEDLNAKVYASYISNNPSSVSIKDLKYGEL